MRDERNTPVEDNPTARSRELGARLKAIREAAGWASSKRLARDLGWGQPVVCRLESGKRAPTALNVATLLGLCRVPREQREMILELTEGGREGVWARPHRGVYPEAVPSVVFQQNAARTITWYDPVALPAILHTTEYAELEVLPKFTSDAEAMPHLGARMDRHAWLCGHDAPEDALFYLHENTLRGLPVDEEARTGQLLYLAMLIGQETIRIRLVPAEHDRVRVAAGGFQVLRFAEFRPVVIVSGDTATLILEGPQHTRVYEAMVDELRKLSLSERDSADLITRLATEAQEALS